MAGESTATLAPVRTYARDLETERKKRGLAPKAAIVSVIKQTPTPPTPKPVLPPPPPPRENTPTTTPLVTIPTATAHTTPKTTHATPTSVPPFHTIQKRTAPPSPSREARITIENDESGATIITDTKRNRFKVGSGIIASLVAWWENWKKARRAKRTPKYVVPETARRKGIIQKATSQTGIGTTGDFNFVRAQVRKRANAPTPHEPHTTWTPNTDPMFPLLEAPDTPPVTNVVVTARYTNTPVPIAPPTPITSVPEATTLPPVPVAVTPTTPPPTPAVTPEAPVTDNIDEDAAVIDTADTLPRAPAPSRRTILSLRDTNTLSLTVVGSLALVLIVGLGVRALTTPDSSSLPKAESVVGIAPLETLIYVPSDTSPLSVAVNTLADDSTSEVVLVSESGTPITPATILTNIDGEVDPAFAQTVTALSFGRHEGIPYLALRVSDRATALGGMLKWEATLIPALATLFVLPSGPSAFTDHRLNTTDIRILRDAATLTRLIYGFSSDNTLIITTNETTFGILASKRN